MNTRLSRLFFPGMAAYYILLAVLCVAAWCFCTIPVAAVETLLSAAVVVFCCIRALHRRKTVAQYFKDASFSVDAVSNHHMSIPLPALILNIGGGDIMWCNDAFLSLTGTSGNLFQKRLSDVIPEFSTDWLLEGKTECPETVAVGDRRYRVYGNMIQPKDETAPDVAATLYWVDLTELLDIQTEFNLSRPVVGIILVDNYEELTANLQDRSVSSIAARLDDTITSWASCDGILRRLERNRYLFLFEQRHLPKFIEGKFSILDEVHAIANDVGTHASLTIGLGRDGQTLQENYDFASLSVDMGLSRGGDQAVIKDRYNFSFYGGRAQEAERRTRVKSRVMAGSLSELISNSSNVLIMGHRNADIDVVGATAGILAVCRKLQCPAKSILRLERNAAGSLIEKLQVLPEYIDAFVSPIDAVQYLDEETLLIIVDTNRPDQLEAQEFLQNCRQVAVIDHHRRAADYIEDALLNFHEPYASSACELVTELVQYLLDRKNLLPEEIMALMSGIVLDTKNFSVRTGARTFEAAAWLRKQGADPVDVKLLFQNDLSATLSRYEILRHAELYHNDIALCCLDSTYDRIIAAQAADELLNISGIQASFVFFPDGDRVICSGRSISDANVQMILEPLGGGGNQATAGAQICGVTPEEFRTALKASIDQFFS